MGKKKIFIFSPLAFSYRLHGPNRRGASQSWAEQGGVQRATPPERDLHCTEQVSASMGALVVVVGDVSAGVEIALSDFLAASLPA